MPARMRPACPGWVAIAVVSLAVGAGLRFLGRFQEGLQAIAGGRYDASLEVKGPPEFARLARGFNHGARVVNLFGGFQGAEAGEFARSTESGEALAAYRKFLRGDPLIEKPKP